MKYTLAFLLPFFTIVAFSHPGIGIVEDSKGNVFFTDLVHVWKITPEGKKTIAVQRVHTHELFIDESDNLFGEHLWYNGEAANTWGHYVWKLAANGTLTKVIPDREGFLEDYSFVRDHFGRMYWADRDGKCQHVSRKNLDGSVTALGDRCFSNIRWMSAGKNEEVILVDHDALKKVDKRGHVTALATDLPANKPTQFSFSNNHSLGGITQDQEGNIYVADLSGRAIKKIDAGGQQSVAAEVNFPWTPTGVLITHTNEMWLLEVTITNEVRVERISKRGERTVY